MQPACELEVARRERRQRNLDHLDAALAHVDEPFHDDALRAEVARELRELRDRDALISDALDVEGGVEHREHEAKVARDGRLASQHELHLLLDREISIVDLVVERDDLVAQLDVLGAKSVHDGADGPERDLAHLLEAGLQRIQIRL